MLRGEKFSNQAPFVRLEDFYQNVSEVTFVRLGVDPLNGSVGLGYKNLLSGSNLFIYFTN